MNITTSSVHLSPYLTRRPSLPADKTTLGPELPIDVYQPGGLGASESPKARPDFTRLREKAVMGGIAGTVAAGAGLTGALAAASGGFPGAVLATVGTGLVLGGASYALARTLDPGARKGATLGTTILAAGTAAVGATAAYLTGSPVLAGLGVGLAGGLLATWNS